VSEAAPSPREPIRRVLARSVAIALVFGFVLAQRQGGLGRWPLASLLVLWVSLGGHWVEVFFLDWLRPRISAERGMQVRVRVGVWFLGGVGLGMGMGLTTMLLAGIGPAGWPAWWWAGLAFVGLELFVHLVLRLLGRPSFYDGRG